MNTAFVKSAKKVIDKAMRLEWRLNWIIENGNKQDRLEILRDPQKVHVWKKWLLEPYINYLSSEEIDVLLEYLGGGGAALKIEEAWRPSLIESLAHSNRLSTEQKRRFARYCSVDLSPRKCELAGPMDLRTGIWLARIRGSNYATLTRLAANKAVDSRVFLYVFRSDPENWVSEKEFKSAAFKRLWDWAVETKDKQVIEEMAQWVAKDVGVLSIIGLSGNKWRLADLLMALPMELRLDKWPEIFYRDALYQKHAGPEFMEWILKERERLGHGGVAEIINTWAIEDALKMTLVWGVLQKYYRPRLSKEALGRMLGHSDKAVRELGIKLIADKQVAEGIVRGQEKSNISRGR